MTVLVDQEWKSLSNVRLVSLDAKRFGRGRWSFIGLGSEKKWLSISEDSPQGEWDHMAGRMLVELAESCCPIFRFTSPLSRSRLKSKGHENCRHFFQPIWKRLRLLSHSCFCKAAQSLRSSRRNARILRNPSRQIGRTRCQRGNNILTRAERDPDRNAFGLWWPT